jgi:polyisoprenoid-binding protein YceI
MRRRIMNFTPLALLSVGLALGIGCSNPADNVSAAKVGSNADQSKTKAPGATTAKRYTFSPEGSKIEFVGSKVTGSHNGGFKKFDGELFGANGKLQGSGNKVTIDTTSVWADNDRLTGHLKSADFFDTEKFPTATFVTTDISQQGTNANVTGNLTLHGITKQISFPASIRVSEQAIEMRANFSLNRLDFEMKYPGKADDLIRKEVVLKLDIKAAPAAKTVAAR